MQKGGFQTISGPPPRPLLLGRDELPRQALGIRSFLVALTHWHTPDLGWVAMGAPRVNLLLEPSRRLR